MIFVLALSLLAWPVQPVVEGRGWCHINDVELRSQSSARCERWRMPGGVLYFRFPDTGIWRKGSGSALIVGADL